MSIKIISLRKHYKVNDSSAQMNINKQSIGGDAQTTAYDPINSLTVCFCLWAEFIRRSVHAGLQVRACGGYDLRG